MTLPLAAVSLLCTLGTIDLKLAAQYFHEAQALSARDGGKTWGTPLYGAMIFVDGNSGDAVANQADPQGKLTQHESVFVGTIPGDFPKANTATPWAGVEWTMILWPLPTDTVERARLMAHELFHRVQDTLGLTAGNPPNSHLDTLEGRMLLQLEWRALRAALKASGDEQRSALEDALVFRARRREIFARAGSEERALERNEGLAEYTGFRVGIADDAKARDLMVRRLNGAHLRPTFVRSFAYETGPAYGLLLDLVDPEWRRKLGADRGLDDVLLDALDMELPDDLAAALTSRAEHYDGGALRTAEEQRDRDRRAKLAAYKQALVTGPRLELPLGAAVQYSFNPNELMPLDDLGTVYPTIQLTDAWGSITAERGALISADRKALFVAAPQDAKQLDANGWKLALAPGWTIVPGSRSGDLTVARQ